MARRRGIVAGGKKGGRRRARSEAMKAQAIHVAEQKARTLGEAVQGKRFKLKGEMFKVERKNHENKKRGLQKKKRSRARGGKLHLFK